MNFDCPHCGRAQTVTSVDRDEGSIHFNMSESVLGHIGLSGMAICCANPVCRKPTVWVEVRRAAFNSFDRYFPKGTPIVATRLIPESSAKPQPDFIPAVLREDYLEACRIVSLSPKASATLARRCLQGMIRDFAGISKTRLVDEVNELRKLVASGAAPKGVSEESVEAIDNVRKIGNIGAHMEKDIDLIVSIDPNEAQILIELIGSLFEEWYVARHKREERFATVKQMAAQKETEKNALGVAPKV